jgi:2,3-bisphosphoglycerate-independent phosphoglycerate mutase
MKNKQVVLIILDGWGYREDTTHNAVKQAKTPVFNSLWDKYPHSLLEASGLAVGLPDGQMGNSEVGHSTIGAGKPLDTDLVRIDKSISSGELDNNPVFLKLFEHVKKNNSTLHVKGLLSDGGVHSHQRHLVAFLRAAKKHGVEKIAIHVFTDGRDTAPQSSQLFIKELESVLEEIKIARIASLSGRYYAMDRDNNWDRLEKAEKAIFDADAEKTDMRVSEFLKKFHESGKSDEHIEPVIFVDDKGKTWSVEDGDAIFFFNFRSDRARMLSKKIQERINGQNIIFATLTEYDKNFTCDVAFTPISIETVLAKEISNAGLTQSHIAETEKFPHVTYFFNGGMQEPYKGEKHILLDSRKDVPTHDFAPKMRAEAIADKAIEEINAGVNFVLINFANPDMVGHTANVPAIIEALEEVDMQLGRVVEVINKNEAVAFITADHGNAEVNVDPVTGEKHTSHTTNPVPAIIVGLDKKMRDGDLADIAPTILSILDIPVPKGMSGKNLLT